MDEDSGKTGWERGRAGAGDGREKREREKGDTFITRRRATGKIERQVVFARGSLPGPRGGREQPGSCAGRTLGCTNRSHGARGKEGTAYGSRGTRIAALPPRSFSMQNKILQIRRKRPHTYAAVAYLHTRTRTDRGKRQRCLGSFGRRGGENAAKSVLCEAGVVRNTRADVETFDIVNLIFPWGAPPPYVFPPISAAVSEDSGLPNRSPTVVLKYTERAGNCPFSLPLSL